MGGIPLASHVIWKWDGTGRGQADLGPVALGNLQGLPAELRLTGTGAGRAEFTAGPAAPGGGAHPVTDAARPRAGLRGGRRPGKPTRRALTARPRAPPP